MYNDRNNGNGNGQRAPEDDPKSWGSFWYVTGARTLEGTERARNVLRALQNIREKVRARWVQRPFDENAATREERDAEHKARHTELMWARAIVVLLGNAANDGEGPDLNVEHLVEWGVFSQTGRPVILVTGGLDPTLYGRRPEVVCVTSDDQVTAAVEMAMRIAQLREDGERAGFKRAGGFKGKGSNANAGGGGGGNGNAGGGGGWEAGPPENF